MFFINLMFPEGQALITTVTHKECPETRKTCIQPSHHCFFFLHFTLAVVSVKAGTQNSHRQKEVKCPI